MQDYFGFIGQIGRIKQIQIQNSYSQTQNNSLSASSLKFALTDQGLFHTLRGPPVDTSLHYSTRFLYNHTKYRHE
jgi:hypothetical protein